MTCIVGMVDNGYVYIGGERGASDDNAIISSTRPKVGVRNGWIYGFAGTFGIGQLIECIDLPSLDRDEDVYTYVRLSVVERLRNAIDTFSMDNEENTTDWLIGCRGRLFEMSSADWGVCEVSHTAIGAGFPYALGSLYTSMRMRDIEERLRMSINAAIEYNPSCRGPVDILRV